MVDTLIIGAGEVGQGLYHIFSKRHNAGLRDIEPMMTGANFDILHIAFPDSSHFVRNVRNYIDEYEPALTIIHSSVKVGTTDQCGDHVVYSPVRGRHPNLAKEMPLYKKFVAGRDMIDVDDACAFFESCKWETQAFDDPCQLETLKLLSNAHMGLEIAWRQEVERMGIERETYQLWEESYRSGYLYSGHHNLIRSIMRPNPIGGHCILECTKLLRQSFQSKVFDFILESNEKAKEAINERQGIRQTA